MITLKTKPVFEFYIKICFWIKLEKFYAKSLAKEDGNIKVTMSKNQLEPEVEGTVFYGYNDFLTLKTKSKNKLRSKIEKSDVEKNNQ